MSDVIITYDNLIQVIKDTAMHDDTCSPLVVEFDCKYAHEDKYDHMIEVCSMCYNYEGISVSWFNDWYEGQQNIKSVYIFRLYTLVDLYHQSYTAVTDAIYGRLK